MKPSISQDEHFVRSCADEGLAPAHCSEQIARGEMVYLRSEATRMDATHSGLLVGNGTRRKITALIGLGPRERDRQTILATINVILAARPDAIIDLTTNPEGLALRPELRQCIGVPLGACLTYDLFTNWRRPISEAEFVERLEAGLSAGLDFALVHMGMDWPLLEAMNKSSRIMPTTSRGGGLVARYMKTHKRENPFLEYIDAIADVFSRLEVVVDLGDIFRPGCVADAGDDLKWGEIELLAGARKLLLGRGAQVLCESGGHMPINRIPDLIGSYKAALGGAPLWLAGPMVVDRAVTLDSIVNTIGVAIAGQYGGDMFASITQNEHYAMPTAPETAEGVRNVRVAIAALDLAREFQREVELNREMSKARRLNAWMDQAQLALYPDLANQVFLKHDLLKEGKPCTICGAYCPHVIVKKDEELGVDLSVVQVAHPA